MFDYLMTLDTVCDLVLFPRYVIPEIPADQRDCIVSPMSIRDKSPRHSATAMHLYENSSHGLEPERIRDADI
jgi:hypothetical protein